jgi:Yip1-like protein
LSQDAAAPLEPQPGPFDVLLNLFVEPRTAFAAILKRPGGFWIPITGAVLLNIVFTAIWMQKMDAQQFIRNEIEQSGRGAQIPPERMEAVVDQQAKMVKIISPISAVVAPPLIILLFGGLFLFVYRFFYGGELGFKQSVAVVAWSSLAIALVSIPIMLAVYAGKGDWNLNPQNVVQANLSLLLDRESTSRALWSLAESIDLFTAWMLFLLATGYGLAIRKPTSAALWGVVIPWALYVVVKTGLVALMS